MYRPRIIPCLLLQHKGLVKSVQFSKHRYLGDPINAVRLFNDLRADELIFLDIRATPENRTIDPDLVRQIGDETNMPFTVGGGIRSLKNIETLIKAGAERVCLNAYALENPAFVREASDEFGASTIVACLDVKKNFWRKESVYSHAGSQSTGRNPLEWARQLADLGVGEIVIQSIEHDGVMSGYNLALTRQIAEAVDIPVVALGGCGSFEHLRQAVTEGKASAASAGSFFVFHGPRRAVLINFPNRTELSQLALPTD
ncbi:AglZ/HisF2 family acetamidino modification protein [Tellurirhabdus bombi]|uniref:AglZ/HisF2 family acetamidino modification protein n=1 Tax=Tellurirhabdus bombi TaxID=2907205 RepID=UPI001F2B0D20|nr:AglZ/HisF2 family acetamidino modification protein [Tellurirhabdus bombi]